MCKVCIPAFYGLISVMAAIFCKPLQCSRNISGGCCKTFAAFPSLDNKVDSKASKKRYLYKTVIVIDNKAPGTQHTSLTLSQNRRTLTDTANNTKLYSYRGGNLPDQSPSGPFKPSGHPGHTGPSSLAGIQAQRPGNIDTQAQRAHRPPKIPEILKTKGAGYGIT